MSERRVLYTFDAYVGNKETKIMCDHEWHFPIKPTNTTDNIPIEDSNTEINGLAHHYLTSTPLTQTQQEIIDVLEQIKATLIEKNRKYGDSALNPVRIFSKCDNLEQLRVRIDDKLSRVASGQVDDDEDVLLDFIGYLVLLLIGKRREHGKN